MYFELQFLNKNNVINYRIIHHLVSSADEKDLTVMSKVLIKAAYVDISFIIFSMIVMKCTNITDNGSLPDMRYYRLWPVNDQPRCSPWGVVTLSVLTGPRIGRENPSSGIGSPWIVIRLRAQSRRNHQE